MSENSGSLDGLGGACSTSALLLLGVDWGFFLNPKFPNEPRLGGGGSFFASELVVGFWNIRFFVSNVLPLVVLVCRMSMGLTFGSDFHDDFVCDFNCSGEVSRENNELGDDGWFWACETSELLDICWGVESAFERFCWGSGVGSLDHKIRAWSTATGI